MANQTFICCPKCGTANLAGAFKCECGEVFTGREGNSIRTTHNCPSRRSGNDDSPQLPSPASLPQTAGFLIPGQPSIMARDVPTRRRDIRTAVVTFNGNAQLRLGPVPSSDLGRFRLNPHGSTNEAAGLRLARETWQQHAPGSRLKIILLGDGKPTAGGGFFGGHERAAIAEAAEIKKQGGRIATIGFRGPSMDLEHLQELASSPGLAWEATADTLAPIFREASTRLADGDSRPDVCDFVVLVVDESGSMDEGSKKAETEKAVAATLRFIATL